MAQRRMLTKTITNSARFIQMPQEAQNLYFHLCMNADDDGIVEAFIIMRMIGSAEDTIKILMAKGYVRPLNEEMVTFILDWNEHNLIRSDRIVKSKYRDLLLRVMPEVQVVEPRPRADTQALPRGNSTGRPVDSLGYGRTGHKERGGKNDEIVDNLWTDAITPYLGKYAPSMIRLFTNHWRAKDDQGVELWEKKDPFDMERKLDDWVAHGETMQHEREQKRTQANFPV